MSLPQFGRRLPLRWSGLPILLTLGTTLAIGCSRAENASPTAVAPAGQEPPQYLPITARWCLEPDRRQTSTATGSEESGANLPGRRCVQLEVPQGNRQIAMGLQLRPPLPPLRGMWFAFDPPAPVKFWMHRTPSPLDMIFVREGQVIAVEADVPPCMNLPCPSYGPGVPIEGVVELAAGQAAALGIGIGTPVRIEATSDHAGEKISPSP